MSMCALKYYTMKKSDRVYFTANILAATDRRVTSQTLIIICVVCLMA